MADNCFVLVGFSYRLVQVGAMVWTQRFDEEASSTGLQDFRISHGRVPSLPSSNEEIREKF
jgi:hypothetical protein